MTEQYSYKPQKGDRVRVTRIWEGSVGATEPTGFRVDSEVFGPWFDFHPSADNLSRGLVAHTVEKLADPEPTWVNGDVILISDGEGNKTPLIYTHRQPGGQGDEVFWACAHCPRGWHPIQHVSADWSNGDVEILYKADAREEVA